MRRMRLSGWLCGMGVALPALEQAPAGPAQGFDIHSLAPHVAEGVVMGPFRHYCKQAQEKPLILECLLYKSTDPKPRLMGVEYFIAKELTRPNAAPAGPRPRRVRVRSRCGAPSP